MTKEPNFKIICEEQRVNDKQKKFLDDIEKQDSEVHKKFLIFVLGNKDFPDNPDGNKYKNFAQFYSRKLFGGLVGPILKNNENDVAEVVREIKENKFDEKTLLALVQAVFYWLKSDEADHVIDAWAAEQKKKPEDKKEEPAEESIEASTVAQPADGETLQIGQTGDPAELATPVLDSEEPVPPGTQNPQPLPQDQDLAMDFDNDIMYSDLDEIIPDTPFPDPIDPDTEDKVTPLAFDRPL